MIILNTSSKVNLHLITTMQTNINIENTTNYKTNNNLNKIHYEKINYFDNYVSAKHCAICTELASTVGKRISDINNFLHPDEC